MGKPVRPAMRLGFPLLFLLVLFSCRARDFFRLLNHKAVPHVVNTGSLTLKTFQHGNYPTISRRKYPERPLDTAFDFQAKLLGSQPCSTQSRKHQCGVVSVL